MSISITVSSTGEWACGNQPDARSLVSFSLFFRYSTSAIIPYFSNRSAGAYKREAMEQARMDDIRRTETGVRPVIDGERSNFRAYDQNQDFFVTVSKKTFLLDHIPSSKS